MCYSQLICGISDSITSVYELIPCIWLVYDVYGLCRRRLTSKHTPTGLTARSTSILASRINQTAKRNTSNMTLSTARDARAAAEPLLVGQPAVPAQASKLSITTQEDGSVVAAMNGQQLNEACWRRCKVLVDMMDECDEDSSGVDATIPIPPAHISLWLSASEGSVSSKDCDALCTIVKVRCSGEHAPHSICCFQSPQRLNHDY